MATTFHPVIDQENLLHNNLSNAAGKSARGRSFGPVKTLKPRNSISQTPRRALGDVGNTATSLTGKREALSSVKPQLKALGKTPKLKPAPTQALNSAVKGKRQAFQILQDTPMVAKSSTTSANEEFDDDDIERENMFPCRDRESKYAHELPLYLRSLLKKSIKFPPPYTEPVFSRQRQCCETSEETVKLDLTLEPLPTPLLDCFSCDDIDITEVPIDETLCDFSALGPVDISLEGLHLP